MQYPIKIIRRLYLISGFATSFDRFKIIISRNYCDPLKLQGICPQECEHCELHLTKMLQLSEARNPEALLTWLARDEKAAMIEEFQEARRPKTPVHDEDFRYGVSDIGNLLEGAFYESPS